MKLFWKYIKSEKDLEPNKFLDISSKYNFIKKSERLVQYPKCRRKMEIKIYLLIFILIKEKDFLILTKDHQKNEGNTFNFFFIFWIKFE
jgi:hypothetical protein